MNRQQRRLADKAKPKLNRSAARYTTAFQLEFETFDSIERLFLGMRNGELEYHMSDGWILMGITGNKFHVVSALEGWVEYWQALVRECGIADYDDKALVKLIKSLEYVKPLNIDHINAAYEVVKRQRHLYRKINRATIIRVAVEEQKRQHEEVSNKERNDEIKFLMKGLAA